VHVAVGPLPVQAPDTQVNIALGALGLVPELHKSDAVAPSLYAVAVQWPLESDGSAPHICGMHEAVVSPVQWLLMSHSSVGNWVPPDGLLT
jgi:hypothetical protein